jgi:hypothetical protein
MANVDIVNVDATFEFEPEVTGTAAPPALPGAAGGVADAQRLRELLRPVILEVLEDELARHSRTRG